MLSSSPSGLRGAWTTRLLLGGVVINSTLSSVFDIKHHFPLILSPHITAYGQYYRLLLWQLSYADASDVVFASLAIYNLRAVERMLGSVRFFTYVTLTWGVSTIIAPVLLALAQVVTAGRIDYVPSGMTSILFAVLYQYVAVVPPTYKFRLSAPARAGAGTGTEGGGLEVSDKSYIYLLMAHLATSHFPGSLIAAAAGWLAGAVYDNGVIPRSWRKLPGFITTRLYSPPVNVTVRSRPVVQQEVRTSRRGANTTTGVGTPGERSGVDDVLDAFTTAGVARPDLAPPSEHDVQTLCAMMGIPRDVAVQHLQAAGGSIERAAETLLAAATAE